METTLIDSPILSPAMDNIADQDPGRDPEQIPLRQMVRDETYEARTEIAVQDLANIPVDHSGSSTEIDLQKSLLASYNDGLGAIVNDRC